MASRAPGVSGRIFSTISRPSGLPATCMPCRKARCSSPTSRSCASPRRCRRRNSSKSRLINILHFQTLIAAKAARVSAGCARQGAGRFRLAPRAWRRSRADGGARKLHRRLCRHRHGAGRRSVSASRSTARWRIPSSRRSTTRSAAFAAFARSRPENLVLLARHLRHRGRGAKRSWRWRRGLKPEGITIRGVRLDCGDLVALSRSVRAHSRRRRAARRDDLRQRRPRRGCARRVRASGRADRRHRHRHQPDHLLRRAGARLRLQTAGICRPAAAQALGRTKRPGRGASRCGGAMGRTAGWRAMCLSLDTDTQQGEPLLVPVMKGGSRTGPSPALSAIRARAAKSLERLPEALRRLEPGAPYPVTVAQPLIELAAETDRRLAQRAAL